MALSVKFRKRLGDFLMDVDFEAENGVLALLGASGCGKSMTLKCIAGIETPDEGRIVLGGRVLFDSEKKIDMPPQKRRVGYLFQNYALFPHMTVYQNIASGVLRKEGREETVREKVRTFCLEGMENKYPAQLSGGQQQRVALARVLANEPEVLMLDEPFSALDSWLRWRMELELAGILEAYSGTTLYVSHNRDEVYRLCKQVCVIDNGRTEPVTSVKALFEDPCTLSSALLSGCKNYSRIKRAGNTSVEALDWGVTLECGKKIPESARYLGVRAHYITPVSGADENAVLCDIIKVIDDVFSIVVMLRPKNAEENSQYAHIRIEMKKDIWAELKAADTMMVKIDPRDILLLE